VREPSYSPRSDRSIKSDLAVDRDLQLSIDALRSKSRLQYHWNGPNRTICVRCWHVAPSVCYYGCKGDYPSTLISFQSTRHLRHGYEDRYKKHHPFCNQFIVCHSSSDEFEYEEFWKPNCAGGNRFEQGFNVNV
jgi:hypothetical protein